MKKIPFCLMLLAACSINGWAQDNADMSMSDGSSHVMMNAKDLKWIDGPPGLPAGAKFAVLSGDPSKEGMFTLRATLPANYRVPPHWHPAVENMAVLEGSLFMGSGETLDESKAMKLTAGGFSSIPAQSPHYVFTKSKCTIQVHAMGPFGITYVNEADDPRKK